MAEERTDRRVYPCGCSSEIVVVDGQPRAMRFVPCRTDCPQYLAVKQQYANSTIEVNRNGHKPV
jgi:hypothetical protein